MKNCIIYLPRVGYVRNWSYAYAKEFVKLGYKVSFIDLDECYSPAVINERLAKCFDTDTRFILSIYGQGSKFTYGGQSIYDYLNVPFLAVCIDHLEYYTHLARVKCKHMFWGLFDASDYYYGTKYIAGEKNFFFLPNTGFKADSVNPDFKSRVFDVTFIGTIPDYEKEQEKWRQFNSPFVNEFCECMIEILLSDKTKNVVEAFEEVMLFNNMLSLKVTESNSFNLLLHDVSHYVRGLRRELMLKTLANEGIKIHCFGLEKDLIGLRHPNFIKHDFLRTKEYLNVLGESKIVIDSLPMARLAMTERLPSGMLNGAAVATDGNEFVNGYYEDGKSMIHYSHGDYSRLSDKIAGLLSRPDELAEIAENGQKITAEHHTIEHRVKTLLTVAEFGKLTAI